MDFDFSEQQEMLRRSARDFLQRECPKSLVWEMEKDERGYSLELWRKMAEMGWMGLVLPEEYGGTGGSFLDLVILLEEMGRACLPGPFFPTVVLGALPLLEVGNAVQRSYFLPKVAEGELILTLALTESGGSYNPRAIDVTATFDGDDYLINGTKSFVPDAHIADYIICAARTTAQGKEPEKGVSLFLLEARSPGISSRPLHVIGGDKQCEVLFNKVVASRNNLIGELGKGWSIIVSLVEKAAVAECARMIGGARYVLEITTDYAKERIQFGHPIGSFQSIRHKCADMAIALDGAVYLTYQTAWKISQRLPTTMDVSATKAWVSEACRQICFEGQYIHAGLGYTQDHEMQLYFRRAKRGEVVFGDADMHREIAAKHMGI